MLVEGSLLDGKYRIQRVLGRGGMSVVYLALNERANKHWAVKEIRKDGCYQSEIARQSLIAETDILKKMRHPSLPRIIDVIDEEDSILLVMDYIHGRSLEEVMGESGPFGQMQVVDWAMQLCDVLDYLHSRNPPIIYRDLKPSNIMLTPEGRLVLIDFGTARELEGGTGGKSPSLGTRGYAAPEQYDPHGQVDARTDIYCLGITLHYLLTGSDPTRSSMAAGPLPVRQINPAISEGVERIVLRCCRESPEDRYQSCRDLLYDLKHYESLSWAILREKRARFRFFSYVCLAALLLGFCSLLTGGYYGYVRGREYKAYIEQAAQAERLSDLKEILKKATALDGGQPGAYELMLSFISSDHQMTDEEKMAMESLLYEKKGGRSNISAFRSHRRAYESFSYDMGLAYFFYYKGSRGKDIARLWFEDLGDSHLDERKRARATIYARIGSYYSYLDQEETAEGTEKGDYNTFFQDLTSLNEFTPEEIGSSGPAVVLYSEIAGQIGNHAMDFIRHGDGDTALRLSREIQRIRRYMTSDIMQTVNEEDREQLVRNLEDADRKIEAAAGQQPMGD